MLHRTHAVAAVLLGLHFIVCAAQEKAPKPPAETHMSKQQADDLFRSVDEILQFVSADSNLPVAHSVKRKLISRDEVNRYLTKKFDEDEETRRMERSELVLKKFGLLDKHFQLRPFLLSLLTEQIAGFYDNKTKTVNLLDWIKPEEQKSVLAHELTHALQDQKVDLEAWSDIAPESRARNVGEDNQHLQTDEASTARAAVAEGQAMAVFLDYSLRGSGKTIADAPGLADKLKQADPDSSGSPILARAPLLLQESLLFPYNEGLAFEQAVLVKSGKNAAFAGVLAHPPSSSFEIMNPEAYLVHTPVPYLRLPDIHPLIEKEYEPYDLGVMGELDVKILSELFAGPEMASALAPAWDGGLYYAAQRRSAPDKSSTASLGLIYASRWKNSDSARTFAKAYAADLGRKYVRVTRRQGDEADGEQVFTTEEGDVVMYVADRDVFVAEGFDLAIARKLRENILGAQLDTPLQTADSTPKGEAALRFAHGLRSAAWTLHLVAAQRYTRQGADPAP